MLLIQRNHHLPLCVGLKTGKTKEQKREKRGICPLNKMEMNGKEEKKLKAMSEMVSLFRMGYKIDDTDEIKALAKFMKWQKE